MVDDPGGADRAGRIDDAADDSVGVDVLAQHPVRIEGFDRSAVELAAVVVEIPPRDSILHRDDDGVGPGDLGDLLGHLFQVMRLQAQDYQVLNAGVLDFVRGLGDLGHVFDAVLLNQFQPVFLDRLEVRTLVDDRDFLAAQRQLGAHQTANGAGADNTNLHNSLPSRLQYCRFH